jgi:NADH:ubiquinone oxidoreductase subunit F (NADH-binding)
MSALAERSEHALPPDGIPRLLAGARPERAATLPEHLACFGRPVAPRDLIASLEEAGLCGRGGAGFRTGHKFRSVAAQRRRPVVVANGAEGEPASSKDKALIRLAPHLVVDGAMLAAHALGAREAVVAVANTAKIQRAVLSHALAERRGLDPVRLTIATVPDAFVGGEETALLRAIGGGPAKPTLKPPYPFERGLGGAPTLVQNVETLAHVALIARFGARWFRTMGADDAPGTALVTLSGAVSRPGVHEIELGSSLGDLVLRAGGATEAVSAFLVGGYFGHWIPAAEAAQVRLTPDALGAGAVIAFPEHACALAECARVVHYLADESAGQCGPCVHGLAAIAHTLERLVRSNRNERADRQAQLLRWTEQIRGRGACRHPDGAARFVESALAAFAHELELHVRHGRCDRPQRLVLPVPHGAAR